MAERRCPPPRPPAGPDRWVRLKYARHPKTGNERSFARASGQSSTLRDSGKARKSEPSARHSPSIDPASANVRIVVSAILGTNDFVLICLSTFDIYLISGYLRRRAGRLIAAPSSTKNAKGERDPEMHQTKKGKQWHFGMKAHIGVDADSGLVHTVIGTATTSMTSPRRKRSCTAKSEKASATPRIKAPKSSRRLKARYAGTLRCTQASRARWT